MKLCNKCGVTKDDTQFRKKGKKLQAYCDKCLYTYQMQRWVSRKVQAVRYKGGKCSMCGYAKNYAALDFHHAEPKSKEYDWNKLRLRSWHSIETELDKCILLCSNCHHEHHSPNLMVATAGIEPA